MEKMREWSDALQLAENATLLGVKTGHVSFSSIYILMLNQRKVSIPILINETHVNSSSHGQIKS